METKQKDFEWPELPPFILEKSNKESTQGVAKLPSNKAGKHNRSKSRVIGNNALLFTRERDYGTCDVPRVQNGSRPEEVPYNGCRTYFELDPNAVPSDPAAKFDIQTFDIKFHNYEAKTIAKTKRHSAMDKHSVKPGTV